MLLIAAIVSLFGIVRVGLVRFRLTEKLMKPLTEEFARTYQHGHPKTKGYDDGGPSLHPRAVGGNNFRLFANPHNL
jgi:hypothetical protein